MTIAIIGGSGFETLLKDSVRRRLDTRYGVINYSEGSLSNVKIIFIPRHGYRHEYPPHKVPYKGIIYTIKKLDIDRVIGISAVGSLREDLPPGMIVIPTQIIDYTSRRETFYDNRAIHVDVTYPYCKGIVKILIKTAVKNNIQVKVGYKYIATEGPRFETPSEIRMFRILGGDIVGMTNIPEVILAREAGLHYSLISIVTNYAAGIQEKVSMDEVYIVSKKAEEKVFKLIRDSVGYIDKSILKDDCTKYEKYFKEIILEGG